MRRGRAALLTLSLLAVVTLAFGLTREARSPKTPKMHVWAVGPMVKIRPAETAPAAAPAIALSAARNEFEPFQVVVRAEAGPLDGVDVSVGDLQGPQGARIPAREITLYREAFLNVTQPSSIEGEVGEWPDALLPKVDRYFGETRGAFPFSVGPDRSQPVWVEIYVPRETPPGTYTGNVRVTASSKDPVSVPFQLQVWAFTLPSTSSLPTSFGLNGIGALKQHRGRYTNDDELLQITALYARAALLHRLSTHGGTMAPPTVHAAGDDHVAVDWGYYDREVGPFLDGNVLTEKDPLAGARTTSVDLRTPNGLTETSRADYWRQWVQHFESKGWMDRLFDYLVDEPPVSELPAVAQKGRSVREAEARIPILVTTRYDKALADVVSIWTPVVNCVDEKPGTDRFCPSPEVPREAYDGEIRNGKRLWWYQSCGSHGCDVVGGAYFTGWPSYVVDVDAVAHRVMEWATWKYRVGGELYYNLDEAYGGSTDPWTDIRLHGGNGDGTLFYPGTPARIGGHTDIPIESLRLKLIREGLEDYEYFTLLDQQGERAFADARVGQVVHRTYDWVRDPSVLAEARRQMGEELDHRSRR